MLIPYTYLFCTLALRRGGVSTLEQLKELYQSVPQKLASMRDIGPQRMALIGEILQACEALGPPGTPAE